MDCQTARDQWHDRLDGVSEAPELDGHLADCPACRAYVDQLEVVVDVLDALRCETADVRMTDRPLAGSVGRGWPVPVRMVWRACRVAAVFALVVTAAWFTRSHWIDVPSLPVDGTDVTPVSKPDVPAVGSTPVRRCPKTSVRLGGQSRAKYLAVMEPDEDCGVDLVFLYPVDPAGD